jgi:hypothetical protein
MQNDEEVPGATRVVPRADLAEVVVQCLALQEALNKSFDLVSMEEGQELPTTDFKALLAKTTEGL